MAPELKTLNLSFIHFPKMKVLAILENIAYSCRMLEELSLEECFDGGEFEQGLESLFVQCPKIKYLNLSENIKLSGACFAQIPTELRYLNIAHCYNLTTESMELVAARAPNLETLILEGYDGDFESWIGQLTKLKALEISNYKRRLDDFVMNFSHLEDLEKLCLRRNKMITTETLQSLKDCPKLKVLDLSINYGLKSVDLEILKNCKSLKFCNFSNWNEVERIADFVQYCQIQVGFYQAFQFILILGFSIWP